MENAITTNSNKENPYIIIGTLAGLHGIQGWFKVISHTRPKDSIKKYKTWLIRPNDRSEWQTKQVADCKPQGKGIVAKLDGIKDRTEAENFTGWEIAIHEQQLPNRRKNEYYWRDLVGLTVINQDDVNFGVVSHLIETGANDVLVVKDKTADPIIERLVPYVLDQFITKIDLEAGTIHVEWDADFHKA